LELWSRVFPASTTLVCVDAALREDCRPCTLGKGVQVSSLRQSFI
jgi:hypothetical protein